MVQVPDPELQRSSDPEQEVACEEWIEALAGTEMTTGSRGEARGREIYFIEFFSEENI
jgi:hypothetical protein